MKLTGIEKEWVIVFKSILFTFHAFGHLGCKFSGICPSGHVLNIFDLPICRFLRELLTLKITADYSSLDRGQLDDWLMKILPELSQYTYKMLKNGMTRELLASTNVEELEQVCSIDNGVHRRLVLEHIEGVFSKILFFSIIC